MKNYNNKQVRQSSALKFILMALVPYSRQNLLLSFSPNRFFNELERETGYSRKTIEQAYRRGQNRGLISHESPSLTSVGMRAVQPFVATQLGNNASLLVIFDIPEENSIGRRQFRRILKIWGFEQVQKSVWKSELDYLQALRELIDELGLANQVEVHESVRLFPS